MWPTPPAGGRRGVRADWFESELGHTSGFPREAAPPCIRTGDPMRKSVIAAAFTLACTAGLLNLPVAGGRRRRARSNRSRRWPPAATPPGAANSTRILYSSTTANDVPTTASAAVYLPRGRRRRVDGRWSRGRTAPSDSGTTARPSPGLARSSVTGRTSDLARAGICRRLHRLRRARHPGVMPTSTERSRRTASSTR